jgi:predicted RNase H-like nuclease (RuvC/YqgF family)
LGHIDQAKEQHVKDLEALVSEYKAHIRALETEIQELAKRPVLEYGSGLQALRDELANERLALQEARRGTSTNPLSSVPSSQKET